MACPADPRPSREFRLLAAALHPDQAAAVDLLRSEWADTDFALLHDLARRHRVAPGLAQALGRAGLAPPPPYADMIGATLSQAAFHELGLAAATGRALNALEANGISAVVLKGVPLSFRLHGRLGLRTSRDIDLLVTPADVGAALNALEGAGFHPVTPLDRARLPALMRRRKDVELISADGHHIVELHWRLFDNPYLLPVSDGLPTTQIDLPGHFACRVLEDRFNLLYLANHGALHGWSRLKWLADFAGLAHCLGAPICTTLYSETLHADGRRALAQAWALARELLGVDAPEQVATDCRRDLRMRLLLATARRIVAGSGTSEIEALRFGSTRKNLSHYLIRSAPAYLLSEAWFDLSQFPAGEEQSRWHRFGPLGRVISWGNRQFARRTS